LSYSATLFCVVVSLKWKLMHVYMIAVCCSFC